MEKLEREVVWKAQRGAPERYPAGCLEAKAPSVLRDVTIIPMPEIKTALRLTKMTSIFQKIILVLTTLFEVQRASIVL